MFSLTISHIFRTSYSSNNFNKLCFPGYERPARCCWVSTSALYLTPVHVHDRFSSTSFGTVEPRLTITSLLRPGPYGPTVAALTEFLCTDIQTQFAVLFLHCPPLLTSEQPRNSTKVKGYARGASDARSEVALARNRRLLLFLKLSKQIKNAFTFWISLMSFLFSTIKNHNFGQLRKAVLECSECALPREGDAPLRLIV